MKQFSRTIAGKTILFFTCLLCAAILAASILGAIAMFDVDMYTTSETEFVQNILANNEGLSAEAKNLVRNGIGFAYAMRYPVYPIGIAAGLGCVVSFIALMCVAGKRRDTEEVVLGYLSRIPFDVLLVVVGFVSLILGLTCDMFWYYNSIAMFVWIALYAVYLAVVMIGLSMCFAARVKQKTLLKGSLTYIVIGGCWKWLKKNMNRILELIKGILLIWRSVVVLAAICFLEFFAIMITEYNREMLVFFWVVEKIILVPAVLYFMYGLRKLQMGGEKIAEGDLEYDVDVSGLFWDLKKHGDNLNSISDGMSLAVDQRMRSERMKTELITNVSHDIKTPLTSIINYVGLLCDENITDEARKEYGEVLTRQSDKLKRLIEDLVEASKASTGNLDMEPVPCDASIFIAQAGGEYDEKMQQAGLQLVTQFPDKKTMIMADSRRMWRVFDNLMNNACKYAQCGTRVYLTLEDVDGQAVITFRNTSREQLNISADELMERFVRGDSSRNTEGNGLGLSIARSLTELQGGTLTIDVDGDLFKVRLAFPMLTHP